MIRKSFAVSLAACFALAALSGCHPAPTGVFPGYAEGEYLSLIHI